MHKTVPVGPKTRMQLLRLRRVWRQGQHILISGSTGSGKTALARHITNIRYQNGGHVIVFCMKPLEDETLVADYKDYTRWKKWKKRPSTHERRVLLWPDVTKAKGNRQRILEIQNEVFSEAFDGLNAVGKWTVQIDEGLYATSPTFLNKAADLAMNHAIGRSGGLTMVTLTQRPSHLPLILYGSASHAFVGRTREATDLKRLAELGAKQSAKDLAARIADQDMHDFLWIPVAPGWDAERMNLKE